MAFDKYVVLGLLMIIALGLVVPYAASTQVYASNGEEARKLVAQKVVDMVRNRINRILNLANEYGIEIPENLQDNIQQANTLLDEASDKVATSPKEAIRLGIKASLVFAPVARYVVKNLPEDAIPVIINERLEKAIEVKLGLVERLNNTVTWLDERGIPYSEDVKTLLTASYEKLMQAKALLESGDYNTSDVAKLIGEASMKLGLATKTLYQSLHKDWVKVNIIAQAGIQMKIHLERLIKILNSTIDALGSGEANLTEISQKLRYIAEASAKAADFIDRNIGNMPEESNITKAMVVIRDALYDVSGLLNEAAVSLDNNDVNSAISAIQAAIDRIFEAMDQAGDYLKDVRMKVIKLREILPQMMHKLKMGLQNFVINKMSHLVFYVGLIDASLHAAYRKYNNGALSQDAFLNLLDRAENMLRTMLDRLNNTPHPPKLVIQKINSILDWINTVRNEIQSS